MIDMKGNPMKLKAIALTVAAVVVSASAYATPIYVGQNLTPSNNVAFGLGYTPTKKSFNTVETGTLMNYALKGDYNVMENLSLGLDLPFYWASKKATQTKSRFGMGNLGFNTNWNQRLSETTDDFGWGYSVSLAAYTPTATRAESGAIVTSNLALDLPRYARGWTSITPTAGLFVENEWFMAKTNIGLAYSMIRKKYAGGDKNRFNTPAQLGVSFKAMPNLAINAEYNALLLDKKTQAATAIGTDSRRLRQVISPSISGEWSGVMAQVYGNIPVDSTSRKATAVNAGLNMGYMF